MQSNNELGAYSASLSRGSLDREALRRSFAEQGYLLFRQVVPSAELGRLSNEIIAEFERVRRSDSLFSGGGTLSGHLNCFPGKGSRFVYDALQEYGIVDLIKALFPRPLGVPYVAGNLNLPGSVVQHYHIDGTYADDFMIANVAGVDTDVENGAIEIIPGSHRKPYKYWRFAVERLSRFGKRIPLDQGDVLVRTSALWHRGMPNRTQAPRPMIAFTFVPGREEESNQTDPFEFNEGRTKFYENWYRTDWRGRLRERTVVAAPITYAGYRFVRSLFWEKGQ